MLDIMLGTNVKPELPANFYQPRVAEHLLFLNFCVYDCSKSTGTNSMGHSNDPAHSLWTYY